MNTILIAKIDELRSKKKLTTRDEMIQFLEKKGYETFFEPLGQNLICYLK